MENVGAGPVRRLEVPRLTDVIPRKIYSNVAFDLLSADLHGEGD